MVHLYTSHTITFTGVKLPHWYQATHTYGLQGGHTYSCICVVSPDHSLPDTTPTLQGYERLPQGRVHLLITTQTSGQEVNTEQTDMTLALLPRPLSTFHSVSITYWCCVVWKTHKCTALLFIVECAVPDTMVVVSPAPFASTNLQSLPQTSPHMLHV